VNISTGHYTRVVVTADAGRAPELTGSAILVEGGDDLRLHIAAAWVPDGVSTREGLASVWFDVDISARDPEGNRHGAQRRISGYDLPARWQDLILSELTKE
jgi:hypothetical protein